MSSQKDIQNVERLRILERLFQKKEAILCASQAIEDLRVKYLANNKQDSEGELEAELYKQIYTIISCLSELTSYATSSSLAGTIVQYVSSMPRLVQGQNAHTPLIERHTITALCASANAVIIRWDFKKGPIVSLDKIQIDSIIQLFKHVGP